MENFIVFCSNLYHFYDLQIVYKNIPLLQQYNNNNNRTCCCLFNLFYFYRISYIPACSLVLRFSNQIRKIGKANTKFLY